MSRPEISEHFRKRQPSSIRVAQLRFAERGDGVEAINVAIGNVSLPMHPAMIERMRGLGREGSPFADGVVKYTPTTGNAECNAAFINVIRSAGFETRGLFCQTTDGGSQAMELIVVGVCGRAGSPERPLLLIDPSYTNYRAFAARTGRRTVCITRTLQSDGRFTLPDLVEIERVIEAERPGALVVIPYDNPTGQYYGQDAMLKLARLCVKHNLWFVSDEAYRELFYDDAGCTSIWAIGEAEVPGISGRRISVETSSKVWSACGLRIGALVTDNQEFHRKAIAEYTANLCPNAIGQYIFGALARIPAPELQAWYREQRAYYRDMLVGFTDEMRRCLPGVIVSRPDAAIYSVVDVRNVTAPGFDAMDFVHYCASEGATEIDGRKLTVLTAPMSGFYNVAPDGENPGRTQMRIAYVEPPDRMAMVPRLLAELLARYESHRQSD